MRFIHHQTINTDNIYIINCIKVHIKYIIIKLLIHLSL